MQLIQNAGLGALVVVSAIACAGAPRSAMVPSEVLGGRISASEAGAQGRQPIANHTTAPPVMNETILDADMAVPKANPTGSAAAPALFKYAVGQQRRVKVRTGGSANAERDSYEAIETIKKLQNNIIVEADYEVLAGSMSAFAGRSSLTGGFVARLKRSLRRK